MGKPKYSNSAGRLLAILNSFPPNRKYADSLIPLMLGEMVAKDARGQSVSGMKAITEFQKLYTDFQDDLSNANIGFDEKEVLVNGLISLQSLFYPRGINETMRQVSDAEKALLEVCATRLDRESEVDEESIQLIQESITELKESIEDLKGDSILRTILLELVRLSEDSINRYNIYGSKGLKKAFKSMLAEVAEVYLQNEESEVEIKKTDAWQSVIKHLKTFDSVAAKTMKYKPLLKNAGQFFIGN